MRHVNLNDLVTLLKTEQVEKRDLVVPSGLLSMTKNSLGIQNYKPEFADLYKTLNESGITMGTDGTTFSMTDMFHENLSEKLQIPKQYYDRMRIQEPTLLDHNVNAWLQHTNKEKTNYFLRTFEKQGGERIARCMLSDRYFVIDHLDILFSVLKVIKDSGVDIQIQDCDLTDKNMYVRFVCPSIEVEAPELLKNYKVPGGNGDSGNPAVMSGFVIKNSETGDGGFTISPRAHILACQNGLIRKEDSFRKIHLGGKLDQNTYIDWSKETVRKNLELIQAQILDCVNKFISKDYLGKVITDITEAGKVKLVHPIDATKNVCKELALSEDNMNEILGFFIEGAQNNAFGVSQALTYFAHETQNAELQYRMEVAGYDIVTDIKKYDYAIK